MATQVQMPATQSNKLVMRLFGNIGKVHVVVAIPVVVSYVLSALFTALAASNDRKFGGKFVDTFWSVFALQTLLFFLLAIRGLWTWVPAWWPLSFKMYSVQMLLILHTQLPNLLLTGVWVTRTVIERIVPLPASGHAFAGKDFTYLTIAMVASNVFSAYSYAIVLANTSRFFDMWKSDYETDYGKP